MGEASAHPLAPIFDAAATGRFPDPDGGLDVFPELPGPADGLFGFTAHFAIAAPIPPAEVLARVPPGDFSFPMSAPFVTWIAERIGARPGVLDAVLCARGRGIGVPPGLVPEPDADHPRVARARRYRHDVTVLRTETGDGVLVVGRGVCGRWEIAFEVEPDARNRGLGRRLIEAGRDIVPAGASAWAQIAPGNAASMRAAIAAGFVPIGSEVLFFARWVVSRGMADDFVTTERDDNGVVLVQLNRPPMNPLSQAMLGALRDVGHELAADATVKAVVVTGSDRAFAAGADIDEFGDVETGHRIATGFRDAFDAIAAIPRPVIAAIRGYALGGGLELAMACDLRVASETARVGQPETLLGVIPGAGATQRLPRLVGPARAKEMIWTGRQIRAGEALAIGLVDRVEAPEEVVASAREWAAELGAGAVVAMGMAKHVIDDGLGRPLAEGLDAEARAFAAVFGTEDAQIGIASFRENGPGQAKFTGR